jgi:hypothetical protein
MENGYARPVEGIYILVDIQNMVVLEFEDRKLIPLPPTDPLRNYTSGETRGGVDRSDVKPLQIIQPEGPSFRVNGHFIQWQKVIVYICTFSRSHSYKLYHKLARVNSFFFFCSGTSVLVSLLGKVWLFIQWHILMEVEGEGQLHTG